MQQRASDAVDFHRQVADRLHGLLTQHAEPTPYVPPTYEYNPRIRQRRFEC